MDATATRAGTKSPSLWRRSNPGLPEDVRQALVRELMAARQAVRDAKAGRAYLSGARARVEAAKRALGDRGPPWWTDGAPDYNRRMVASTPYADWFASLSQGGSADQGNGPRVSP